MKIVITGSREDMGRYVAKQAAESIRSCLREKEFCNIVVATGSSQFEVLNRLVEQSGIAWDRVNGFHLDEYLGLDRNHSASFCGYLASRFVDKVPLRSFHYLDGTLPAEQLQQSACAAIGDHPIDLLLCGIGENGHLAFNDPPADFEAKEPYLIVELDEACRRQQVGEGWFDAISDVPDRAISMSIRQIMSADEILCTVPDRRKAAAVAKTVDGDVNPAVPASILQQHPHVTLILDQLSSAQLSPSTLERCRHLDSAACSTD